jgi:hypothetical protein
VSAPQFTPAPWHAGSFSSIVGVPVMAQPDPMKNTFNVCGVAAPVSREENIANARLIAAAPELYEALDAIVRSANQERVRTLGGLWPMAVDALAKARGETA